MRNKTFTWYEIKDGIVRSQRSPITKLIEKVIDSGISNDLYPATMHTNLRIGRFKNFSKADGELTVEYNNNEDKVIFNYYESENCNPWSKKCNGNEIIPTFMHIITKRLHWVKNVS